MALRIKQSIINATEFRSDGLGVLASIAWAAETVGRYRGTVRRGDAAVASFELEVDKGGAASQLDIDLNDLAGASLGGARAARRFQVASAERSARLRAVLRFGRAGRVPGRDRGREG